MFYASLCRLSPVVLTDVTLFSTVPVREVEPNAPVVNGEDPGWGADSVGR